MPTDDPSPVRVLFLCTGNTCRSPMAEALAKQLLANKFNCAVADLPQRGYVLHSAGLAAAPGESATPEAVDAVRELGADLSGHVSQPADAELLWNADRIVTMTHGHLALLSAYFPDLPAAPRLLCGEHDLPDPFGGDTAAYRACAEVIHAALGGFVAELAP